MGPEGRGSSRRPPPSIYSSIVKRLESRIESLQRVRDELSRRGLHVHLLDADIRRFQGWAAYLRDKDDVSRRMGDSSEDPEGRTGRTEGSDHGTPP